MTSDTIRDTPLWLDTVVNWDGNSPDIHQALIAGFEAEDYLTCIKGLEERGIEPVSYINNLDKVINSLPSDSDFRQQCLRALRKTCGLHGILPDSYTITYALNKTGGRAIANGSFADVWKVTNGNDEVFAVKVLRVTEQELEQIKKTYCKEVVVFKRVDHQNVLSIEGVAPTLFEFCMVSRWMEHGNMSDYLNEHPGANRLELLIGVAHGLNYLHCNQVVHGDLKSSNVLIDTGGIPRICDYGLSSTTRNDCSVNASTPNHGSTFRYRAPELLDTEKAAETKKKRPTSKSDVYSLSMVIVELVTGKVPFAGLTDYNAVRLVSKGKRPTKPRRFDFPGTSEAVWKVAEKCWHSKADRRPEVKGVLLDFDKITNSVEGGDGQSTWKRMWHYVSNRMPFRFGDS
ncbi:kinase-like domain-containing protein [Thelephora terrestris]|uniref:Kinase-like domain-containing protein n=1 Tax=Thelephora terrestris TaxID=56493 RepID=A0A9P6HL54_9AGAM|nr:kinase-like domain-containing protein [Thelephora terrestris]